MWTPFFNHWSGRVLRCVEEFLGMRCEEDEQRGIACGPISESCLDPQNRLVFWDMEEGVPQRLVVVWSGSQSTGVCCLGCFHGAYPGSGCGDENFTSGCFRTRLTRPLNGAWSLELDGGNGCTELRYSLFLRIGYDEDVKTGCAPGCPDGPFGPPCQNPGPGCVHCLVSCCNMSNPCGWCACQAYSDGVCGSCSYCHCETVPPPCSCGGSAIGRREIGVTMFLHLFYDGNSGNAQISVGGSYDFVTDAVEWDGSLADLPSILLTNQTEVDPDGNYSTCCHAWTTDCAWNAWGHGGQARIYAV